jgi:hypothetical protein
MEDKVRAAVRKGAVRGLPDLQRFLQAPSLAAALQRDAERFTLEESGMSIQEIDALTNNPEFKDVSWDTLLWRGGRRGGSSLNPRFTFPNPHPHSPHLQDAAFAAELNKAAAEGQEILSAAQQRIGAFVKEAMESGGMGGGGGMGGMGGGMMGGMRRGGGGGVIEEVGEDEDGGEEEEEQ